MIFWAQWQKWWHQQDAQSLFASSDATMWCHCRLSFESGYVDIFKTNQSVLWCYCTSIIQHHISGYEYTINAFQGQLSGAAPPASSTTNPCSMEDDLRPHVEYVPFEISKYLLVVYIRPVCTYSSMRQIRSSAHRIMIPASLASHRTTQLKNRIFWWIVQYRCSSVLWESNLSCAFDWMFACLSMLCPFCILRICAATSERMRSHKRWKEEETCGRDSKMWKKIAQTLALPACLLYHSFDWLCTVESSHQTDRPY